MEWDPPTSRRYMGASHPPALTLLLSRIPEALLSVMRQLPPHLAGISVPGVFIPRQALIRRRVHASSTRVYRRDVVQGSGTKTAVIDPDCRSFDVFDYWNGGWHMWWMGTSWVIGLILLAVFFWVWARSAAIQASPPIDENPEVILKRRYARGEISTE